MRGRGANSALYLQIFSEKYRELGYSPEYTELYTEECSRPPYGHIEYMLLRRSVIETYKRIRNMSKINFLTVKVGNSLSTINENFQRIKDELQNKILYRNNPVGEPNTLITDVDANNNNIFNIDELETASLKIGGTAVVSSLVDVPITSYNGRVGDIVPLPEDKTGLVLVKADVGLSNVDDTSDVNKPISTSVQTALDLKAPLASPTFTGTVSGITKAMVGLSNVDNTSDANKPVSTSQQTALNLKANLASPVFTGSPTGVNNALGIRGTALATMESFNTEFANTIGANGTYRLPNGLILKWGLASGTTDGGSGVVLTFPTPFTTTNFITVVESSSTSTTLAYPIRTAPTVNGCNIVWINSGAGIGAGISVNFLYFAIGN